MLCWHAFLRQGESGKGGTPQIMEKRPTNITSNKKAPNQRRCKFQKASKGHIRKTKKTSFGKLLPSTYPHNETTHTKTTSQHP